MSEEIVYNARLRMWQQLQRQKSIMNVHLSHLYFTEPPPWERVSHDELEGMIRTLENLSNRFLELRLEADIDNGPMSGRERQGMDERTGHGGEG